ncbi:MAG: double-strand break repair protein AddB [Rhodospirillaceae bacterium]
MSVCSIPAGFSFVDELAAGILDRYGSDPIALAGVTVLLPTRRACRSLRDAFLRLTGGRPLLLPGLSPLGDLDAEGLGMALEELPQLAGSLDLPPAIGELRRRLLLTQVIMAAPGFAATAPQAVRLAGDLSRLLDQVETERLGFDRLENLVPADYAEHWQITLGFLTILTARWPEILIEEGACDATRRRNLVMAARTAAWRERPPVGPVIAAGSTGSIPATGALLELIATLPEGTLVLPGLDTAIDDMTWAAIAEDESHPQHTLASLLERLGLDRSAVQPWRSGHSAPRAARAHLLAEVLRPATTTESWRELDAISPEALDGLTRIDCPTAQEEAEVIALLLRHALETPEVTAALVTPDRTLARRVAAALTRWDIRIDDTGGQPLADTAVGSFLRLAANALVERFAPVPLLSLLKHPLAAAGQAPSSCRYFARGLERAVLRGPRPAAGLAGVRAGLDAAGLKDEEIQADLAAGLDRLERFAAPFVAFQAAGSAPMAELLRAHLAFVEAMAATEDMPGASRLWRRDDGEAAASFVNELLLAAADFPAISLADYPGLFDALMSGRVVRPRFGRHPRLAILGPLEARLQHCDLMILGGLNEGSWPAEPAPDPWMSRPMRKAFGLPAPERQIGLAAHDFAQAATAPQVVLTRAERLEGAPTVPSRWLSRLDTVLRAFKLDALPGRDAAVWLGWAGALGQPAVVRPSQPPEPRPPLAARPRTLSVTEIETWMRDPYAIYARHVLKLRVLDPLAADPGAAERGQFIHAALDGFVRECPGVLPPDALDRLLRHGRTAFGDLLARPEVWAFWWPRFERIAGWVVAFEAGRRPLTLPVATEIGGSLELYGPGGKFTLRAKADRLDRLPDGRLSIIDYKTGTLPSSAEIALGLSPQLPLEAVMAEAGAFIGLEKAPVGELAFWRLSGGDPAGEEKPVRGSPAELAAEARCGLEALIRTFDDPATAYRSRPRPRHAPRFDEYAHLSRVQEWSAGGIDAE